MSQDQVIDTENVGPARDRTAVLRKILEEQRRFRRDQLGGPAVGSGSVEAPGQSEVHRQVLTSAAMVLADVEAALTRMEEGTYGICQLCSKPIAPERLEIVPQARYCVRCQQVREAGR